MPNTFRCVREACARQFPLEQDINRCPACGGLLDVVYDFDRGSAVGWPPLWSGRRKCPSRLDASGVWRFRELIPFLTADEADRSVATLGEGNTPLLESRAAAAYAGLHNIRFKHQGFNPTG